MSNQNPEQKARDTFECIIILNFVLLGQFAAIGFLITGKSFLPFASCNMKKRLRVVKLID